METAPVLTNRPGKTGSANISVVALVGANCSTRLRAENAVNGPMVITGTGEPAL